MEFLLVDDNEISLEIQKLMLESCGLAVVTADCGQEAVRLAGEKKFFLIFMDLHMPDISGFRAAELIRENDKDTPIIALSADKISEDDPEYIRSGMNGALMKPLQMSDLKELLTKYLTLDVHEESTDNDPDSLFAYDELLSVMKEEKAVIRLLDRSLTAHKDDCSSVQDLVWHGNYLGAREILHNIIGISGNMFCRKLYGIACTLGSELRNDRHDSLDIFASIWNDTFEEVKRRRSLLTETADDGADTDWNELSKRFFALCEDFDVAAAELFAENINCFRANMAPDIFEKVKEAVLSYDFAAIIDDEEVCGNV